MLTNECDDETLYFGNILNVEEYPELHNEPFFSLNNIDINSEIKKRTTTTTTTTKKSEMNDTKRTPLHLACISDNIDEVKVLIAALSSHTSLDHKDSLGRTALHLACWQRNCYVARLLLEAGADFNALDIRNNTPIHLLCFSHTLTSHKTYVKLVLSLIDYGANLEVINKDGHFPLDFVSDSGRRNQIKVYKRIAYRFYLFRYPSHSFNFSFIRNTLLMLCNEETSTTKCNPSRKSPRCQVVSTPTSTTML